MRTGGPPDVVALYLDEAVALLEEAGYDVSRVAATAPPRQRGELLPNQRYRVVSCVEAGNGDAEFGEAGVVATSAIATPSVAKKAADHVVCGGRGGAEARKSAVELLVTAATDVGKL
jgi:hypothetical protein